MELYSKKQNKYLNLFRIQKQIKSKAEFRHPKVSL